MFTQHISNVPVRERSGLHSHILLQQQDAAQSNLAITWVEVEPGQQQRLHHHPAEQVYVIVQGEGEMQVGAETAVLHTGHLVYIPSNQPHGITNTGREPLVYISAATPSFDMTAVYDQGQLKAVKKLTLLNTWRINMRTQNEYIPGLAGVVAAQTRLSRVDGQRGELIIAGFPLAELAGNATFEETAFLLWNGRLPTQTELAVFQTELAGLRPLPAPTLTLLESAAARHAAPMDALRMAAGTLNLDEDDQDAGHIARVITARFPTIIAAYWRFLQGKTAVAPDPSLSHAANYLYMLTGSVPSAAQTRGLETYLNTVVDHGLNASTFAARVIIATQSDMVSAIVGAVGALKGPLHGGAPGPALDMVFEIGSADRAEQVLRQKLERGERLMGFGHRVYKVRDPRAEVLGAAAERLFAAGGDMSLYKLVKAVEQTAVSLLAEYKPGRNLQTNVEFYTALLLHGLELDTALFTPTFAMSRVAGWIGHCFEQIENGRIIRPQSTYIGETGRKWEAIAKREE